MPVYVGPQALEGLEENWIPTAGKRPFLMFRFYGPEREFYDKSWKLPDFEKVKQQSYKGNLLIQ